MREPRRSCYKGQGKLHTDSIHNCHASLYQSQLGTSAQNVGDIRIRLWTHTGTNVKQTLDNILSSFNVDVERVTLVSDRGSNMPSALREYEAISCCDHILNIVLSTLLDNKQLEDLLEVRSLLTGSKQLVWFCKKSPRSQEVAEEKSEPGSNDQMEQYVHNVVVSKGKLHRSGTHPGDKV